MELALCAGLHVDTVNTAPVGGVGEANRHLHRIALGLRQALGKLSVPWLCFNNSELVIAVHKHVVRNLRLGPASAAFEATLRDGVFAQDTAVFAHAPAPHLECGIDVFCSGLSFVHGRFYRLPTNAWSSIDFFNASNAAT